MGNIGGTIVGNFLVHSMGLREGALVQSSGGGQVFTISQIIWIGVPGAVPSAFQAIVVVNP